MNTTFQKLVLASNNEGKCREFAQLLAPLEINIVSQASLGVSEADEPYATFVENALAKARHASRCTGLPALADDSGLCADALNGAPGVLSARYAGEPKSDARNNAHLIEQLQGTTNRRACYVCVLVLTRSADDPAPLIAFGKWFGEIIDTPRGANGFGYDPYFLLPDGRTAAEMAPEEKNAVSHRGRAVRELMEQFRECG
ncbi:MAG: RdgB/HAM1 family non-canonical purine NTP pyrophosphatase [Proteobacteria bacterium]|nr:RdgB/HAM1 family non-canonical purine NTP pyrophosphatase [Pseudomonadota bacterium]MCL2307719.1 RdgB/HAM1 family non-canonical purine NTP pyrophosphatase [Pseudomonadota bacterium]